VNAPEHPVLVIDLSEDEDFFDFGNSADHGGVSRGFD
jgi:hypothetical protein